MTVATVSRFGSCWPTSSAGLTEANQLVFSAVLPSAFRIDPSGQPVLDTDVFSQVEVTATSPLTVTYSFNPKAVWDTGERIGPADLIAAWHRGTTLQLPTAPGYRLIAGITSSRDGEQASVVFTSAYADWRSLFANLQPASVVEAPERPCALPTDAVDAAGGPFRIASASSNAVTLTRNPRWWGTPAALDRLVVRTAPSASVAAAWVLHNVAQVTDVAPVEVAALRGAGQAAAVTSSVSQSPAMLQLLFSSHRGPGSITEVRRAIAGAISPPLVGEAVSGPVTTDFGVATSALSANLATSASGTDLRANRPFPTSSTTTTAPTPAPTTTTTIPAGTGLPAAGFHLLHGRWVDASHRPLRLRLAFDPTVPSMVTAVRSVIDQVAAAGVTLVPVPSASPAALLFVGSVDAAILARQGTPYVSQSAAWWTLDVAGASPLDNPTRVDVPAVNAAFTLAQTQLNPVDAAATYHEIDRRLAVSPVVVPLVTIPRLRLQRSHLSRVVPNPWGPWCTAQAGSWQILVPVGVGDPTTPILGANQTSS